MSVIMTLNHGLITTESKDKKKWKVECGKMKVGGYPSDHKWVEKLVESVDDTIYLSDFKARELYNSVKQSIIENKSVRLLKRVHSPIFEKGSGNWASTESHPPTPHDTIFIVYSHRDGYNTKRYYIKFEEIKDKEGDKEIIKDSVEGVLLGLLDKNELEVL
tara:strand:+ start:20 stop:502 length:483 start_codon:yes stop_codon:yes gene_type:complete